MAATFDPHGNEDAEFLRHADMAFAVKYFPHYDMHLQGQRAARMLVRTIRGSFRPAHRTISMPIIAPTVVMWTGASPWSDLVQRALVWEAREPDVFVNVFFGFPWSDVPDAGMAVQVLTNGDPALADRVARRHGGLDVAASGRPWCRASRSTRCGTALPGRREAVRAGACAGRARRLQRPLGPGDVAPGARCWRRELARTLVGTVASPAVLAGCWPAA